MYIYTDLNITNRNKATGRVAAQHIDRSGSVVLVQTLTQRERERTLQCVFSAARPARVFAFFYSRVGVVEIFKMTFILYVCRFQLIVWLFTHRPEVCLKDLRSKLHCKQVEFFSLILYFFFCSVQTKVKQKYTGSRNIKHTVCYKHNVQDTVRARSPGAACGRRSIQDVVRVQDKKPRQSRQEVFLQNHRSRFKDTLKIITYVVWSRK